MKKEGSIPNAFKYETIPYSKSFENTQPCVIAKFIQIQYVVTQSAQAKNDKNKANFRS
jgi:hypothetical protein